MKSAKHKVIILGLLLIMPLTLAGCGTKTPPKTTPTTTAEQIVPPPIDNSITQIAFRVRTVALAPWSDFLFNVQKYARTYWRDDASLRQIDIDYDKTTDRLGYQMRFISLSKTVNNNPDTLTVYYNYDMPVVEQGAIRKHQPTLNENDLLIGLTCESGEQCNLVNYIGRQPIPINEINLSFLESYAKVADKVQPIDAAMGAPPYKYSLQVEAGQAEWIFYNWRVNASTGEISTIALTGEQK